MVFLAAMENMTMTLKTMLTAQHTHVSQYSGGEIKGTSLRQLPASGISLSKQTRRWRHGQHLRHHSADWKQVALWLIRKIDIVPHSSEKHAKMWSSFIFPLMICSETQRKQWSAHISWLRSCLCWILSKGWCQRGLTNNRQQQVSPNGEKSQIGKRMQRQRCLFYFYKSSVVWKVKQAGLRWKQCVSILKRNVNRMGKTCKYEDGWSFTEAQGLKAQSS